MGFLSLLRRSKRVRKATAEHARKSKLKHQATDSGADEAIGRPVGEDTVQHLGADAAVEDTIEEHGDKSKPRSYPTQSNADDGCRPEVQCHDASAKHADQAGRSCVDNEDRYTDEKKETDAETPTLSWKEQLLEGQKSRECDAMLSGRFVKKQRVSYFHKLTETWYDEAHVIAVHLDDGPDQPYYTIRYIKNEQNGEVVEKQTTPDRLRYVLWNDDKSWSLINPEA